MTEYDNFTEAYVDLLANVYTHPEFECQPRGMKIKESLGVKFVINNPRDRIPFVKGRKFSIPYLVSECMWYLSGNDRTDWISNYSSFWKNISDDGLTANSAYGARIFRAHDRIAGKLDPKWTQWNYVLEELERDPDSRRAVIHIRSPQDSILAKLDVPCTLSLQFFLRNDEVHLVASMRSSDLILGLAYDVPAFTMFQELLAHDLSTRLNKEIGLGSYTHVSNSLHIYDRHFDMVERIIGQDVDCRSIEMPRIPVGCDMKGTLDKMMVWEDLIRTSPTAQELEHRFKRVTMWMNDSGLDPYFVDWMKVLASHKAGKLDDELLKEKFIMETDYKGYRFFK